MTFPKRDRELSTGIRFRTRTAERTLILLDNGSSRAASTRRLRGLAEAMAARIGEPVWPVSLLHADKAPLAELDGVPAETLAPFLDRRLAAGERCFLIAPLFFGPSRALTDAIPEIVAAKRVAHGPFSLDVAPPLCPPGGEPRLIAILGDHLAEAAAAIGARAERVVLVDHGSPIPQVTAARQWLAAALRERLGASVTLTEAAMERRPGPAYDFNGEPLEHVLARLAAEETARPIFLLPLFLAPGRHAGPGGDIAGMRRAIEAHYPGLKIVQAKLVGDHPDLIEILAARVLTRA